jgi:hypothetical protein
MLLESLDSCSDAAADPSCIDVVLTREGHERVRDEGPGVIDDVLGERPRCIVPSQEFATHGSRLPPASQQLPGVLSGFYADGVYQLLLDVSPDLCWFEGHFPGQPVLPGVIQLHWATVMATALYELDRQPRQIKRLKFSNVIVPPRIVELVLERPAPNQVQFRVQGSGVQNSQGRLDFGDAGS